MNHYVCDSCGHRWTAPELVRCAECGGRVVYVWHGDGAEANAKAQALRISRERSEAIS